MQYCMCMSSHHNNGKTVLDRFRAISNRSDLVLIETGLLCIGECCGIIRFKSRPPAKACLYLQFQLHGNRDHSTVQYTIQLECEKLMRTFINSTTLYLSFSIAYQFTHCSCCRPLRISSAFCFFCRLGCKLLLYPVY